MSSQGYSTNTLFAALRGSNLLVLTTLAAVDGTVFLLAASGELGTLSGALVAGLTVVAGAGAWVAAQREYGPEMSRTRWLELGAVAAVACVATVTAAALGATLSGAVDLLVLPRAAGVILILVALEIGGVDLPRVKNLPLTVVALVAALSMEVSLQWTL